MAGRSVTDGRRYFTLAALLASEGQYYFIISFAKELRRSATLMITRIERMLCRRQ